MEYRTKKRIGAFGFAVMATIFSIGMEAQAGDPATLIQEKLVSQIKLTKATADRSNIVTAGDVVVLHKDGLMMCSSASSYPGANTYSNGVLAANYTPRATDALKKWGIGHIPGIGSGTIASDAANNACASHKFVAGEKFWVTEVVAKNDHILIRTFSDPFPDPTGNQVRYYGEITFPFAKHSVPSVDDFVKTVSEVMTVQPADDQGGQGGQAAQPHVPPAAPAAVFTPDTPPPPPSDAPPTMALGQTKAGAGAASHVSLDAKPTPAQTAAVKRAFGADFADMTPFLVGQADLNGDGRPDLIILSQNPLNCGSGGCEVSALLATANGYAAKGIDLFLSSERDFVVLDAVHHGMHDLRVAKMGSHLFSWDGKQYQYQ
jgi:hypothetical protein